MEAFYTTATTYGPSQKQVVAEERIKSTSYPILMLGANLTLTAGA